MPFAEFKGYGRSDRQFINTDRVISFQQLDYPANCGTEIRMDDGSKIKVGHWPEQVKEIIDTANVSIVNQREAS